MKRFLIALAAAAMAAVAPLQAQPAPPAERVGPVRVRVPFNPPLGRPLHYRSTVRTQNSSRSTATSTDYEITFSRDDDGFRMHVNATGARDELTGNPSPLYLPPYTLLLDEDGKVTELENGEAYWNALIQAPRPALRTMNGGMASNRMMSVADYALRDSTPEARLNHLTRYIGLILDYSADEYVLGEDRVQVDPISGLMGTTVTQRLVFRAERLENGRLFMSTRTTVSGEEMRDQLVAAFERAPANGQSSEERTARLAQLRAMQMERVVTARFELSVATGLVQRLQQTDLSRRTEGTQQRESIQRLTIERLD